MYDEHRDFHESYFDHSCPIIAQNDVLETDIIGTGSITSLKRWWSGLFLLSSSDKRSRTYYTSSYAITMDRIKHFRRHRNRIHPLSKFRHFWDNLIICVFISNKFIFHHNASIFGQVSPITLYLGAFFEFVIIIDMIVNMQTGYIDQESRRIILSTKKGLLRYCSTKLFMHTVSIIPLQWIMFTKYGVHIDCNLCKTNNFICTIRILNAFTLYRVYETTGRWTRPNGFFRTTDFLTCLRIAVVGFITMQQLCHVSDTISLITILATGHINEQSYVSYLILCRFGINNPPPEYKFVCLDLARIFKSLLLFSFGLTKTTFHLDEITYLVAHVIGNIFYMWCLLECYAYVSSYTYPEDKTMVNRCMTLNLVKSRQLPDTVSQRVFQYYDFTMARLISIRKQNGLFVSLPDILKKETILSYYSKYVLKIPYFANWPKDIVDKIVFMLKEEVYLRNDIIVEPWVPGEGLIIVDCGELAVYTVNKKEIGHLIDGDFFGELSLVTDNEVQMLYVAASTRCTILLLEKCVFRQYMRQYPKLFFSLRDKLKYKFNVAPHAYQKYYS